MYNTGILGNVKRYANMNDEYAWLNYSSKCKKLNCKI